MFLDSRLESLLHGTGFVPFHTSQQQRFLLVVMDKISRKGHSFVQKESKDKCEQAGASLKAQTIA